MLQPLKTIANFSGGVEIFVCSTSLINAFKYRVKIDQDTYSTLGFRRADALSTSKNDNSLLMTISIYAKANGTLLSEENLW